MGTKILFAMFVLVLAGCQTTSGESRATVRYKEATACIQSHVESGLTAKKETPDEIRALVYGGFKVCQQQMNDYIRALEEQTRFELDWSVMPKEDHELIVKNVYATTSIVLQEIYNKKEQEQ